MTRHLVYLSGPISATDYEGATNWYDEAREYLAPEIGLLAPMRGKEYFREHKGPIGHAPFPDKLLATGPAITGRDRFDTQRASAVLMNLIGCKGRVSIGCMIEAGWADAARVPIVLCMEPGNVHEGHAILETLATYRTHTLRDACHALNILFLER